MKLLETEISSEEVYLGDFLRVRKDHVRLPDGTTATREYIPHPGASMIVPIAANGNLIMIKQFRYPVRQEFIEFPAGKIDKGEDPLETAKRELLEETGYRAKTFKHLITIHPVIGYSDEKIAIYLAKDLTAGTQKLDVGEFVNVFEMSFEEAMSKMQKGEITDVKTMIGLFWYQQVRGGNW